MKKLIKMLKIIARDFALSIGFSGKRNVSHGTIEEIAIFHDNAEEIFSNKQSLWAHEQYIIENYFPHSPAKILDIGCGGGRTTTMLSQMGYKVTGIDLSKNLIEYAKKNFPDIEFYVMDASNMTFPDNYFDAALFSFNGLDCVVPVSMRLKILREIHRVIRPGGKFYFSSHNIWGKLIPEHKGLYNWAVWGYEWMHILLRQLLNFHIFRGYWWYYDIDGWQLLYSASPYTNLRQFEETGWIPIAVLSRVFDKSGRCLGFSYALQEKRNKHDLGWITLNEHHVQYILEKSIPK